MKNLYCLFFVLAIFMIAGCKSAMPKTVDIPGDFEISFGSGGGFTGMWFGKMFDSSGVYYEWEGRIQEQKLTPQGKVNQEKLGEIFCKVKNMNLMEISKQETSNMTNYLRIKFNGKENAILWNPFARDEISTQLTEFLTELQNIAAE